MIKRSFGILIVALVFLFSGCTTTKNTTPTKPQSFIRQGALPGTTTTSRPAPKQIASIRTNINALMKDLDNKNWSKSKNRANIIRSDISKLRAELSKATTGTTGTAGTTGITGTRTGTTIGNTTKGMGNTLGNTIGNTTNGVGNTINGVGNTIGNTVNGMGNTLGNTTGIAGTNLNNIFLNALMKNSSNLDRALGGKNLYQSKVCANQLYKNLADLAMPYTNAVPVDVDNIEYYARQIALDCEKKNWAAARTNLSSCKNSLSKLNTSLNGKNRTEITNIERDLAKLSGTINSKDSYGTIKYSNSCLRNAQGIRTSIR